MHVKKEARLRRARSGRLRIHQLGAVRLCIHRTPQHIYAQVIDDSTGKSIVQAGSTNKEIVAKVVENQKISKTDVAKLVGELIADKAKEKGVDKVVFDRKGYAYHGRVKALADAARKKGLQF